MSLSKLNQAVYLTVAYASIFDFPLLLNEIVERLQSCDISSAKEIKKSLGNLIKFDLIDHHNKFYFLINQQNHINKRINNQLITGGKIIYAKKILTKLALIPYLKAILITGSVAAENAHLDDDIDILLITASNRLWIVRLLVNIYLDLYRVRRKPNNKNIKNKICPNIWMEETFEGLFVNNQNLYTAQELLQAKPLIDLNNCYLKLLETNQWVRKYMGNWYVSNVKCQMLRANKVGNNKSTYSIFRIVLDLINFVLFRFQLIYMRNKKTTEYVSYHQAMFHPGNIDKTILASFELSKNSIS